MFDNEVTLIYDCEIVESMRLNRTYPAVPLDNEGVIVLSRDLMSDDHFEVTSWYFINSPTGV